MVSFDELEILEMSKIDNEIKLILNKDEDTIEFLKKKNFYKRILPYFGLKRYSQNDNKGNSKLISNNVNDSTTKLFKKESCIELQLLPFLNLNYDYADTVLRLDRVERMIPCIKLLSVGASGSYLQPQDKDTDCKLEPSKMLIKNIITSKEQDLEKMYDFLNAYPTSYKLLVENTNTIDALSEAIQTCQKDNSESKGNKREIRILHERWNDYVSHANIKTIDELDFFMDIMKTIRQTIKTKLLGFNYPLMKSTIFNVPAIGYLEALYNIDLLKRKLGFTVANDTSECKKWELTAFYEYVKVKAAITVCKTQLNGLIRKNDCVNLSYPTYSDLFEDSIDLNEDVIRPTMTQRLNKILGLSKSNKSIKKSPWGGDEPDVRTISKEFSSVFKKTDPMPYI